MGCHFFLCVFFYYYYFSSFGRLWLEQMDVIAIRLWRADTNRPNSKCKKNCNQFGFFTASAAVERTTVTEQIALTNVTFAFSLVVYLFDITQVLNLILNILVSVCLCRRKHEMCVCCWEHFCLAFQFKLCFWTDKTDNTDLCLL